MPKMLRILLVSLSLSLLLAATALAGPGTRTDGDPDQPQKTPPGRTVSRSGSAGAELLGTSTMADEGTADANWLVALRVYLRIFEIIVR
jgi:hypothetical protein